MYQVTIKGKNLQELKDAVKGIHEELSAGKAVVNGMTKDLASETPALSKGEARIKEVAEMTHDAFPEVDAEGIPWDKRIHSNAAEKKKADGTWKLKRGVDKNLVDQVKAELKGETVVNDTPAVVETPVVNDTPPVVETPAVVAAPPMPPVNNNAFTLDTFRAAFAQNIAQLVSAGKVTPEYIETIKGHLGLAEIWQATPEQQESIFNTFTQYNVIERV